MARTRSIKPGFFDNEILGDLPALTRLLFIGLWCIADREGRLEDRPKRIRKALLGYDDVSTNDITKMLQELHDTGFITRYTIQNEDFIEVVNFTKHQNPHIKEKDSEIPPPPEQSSYRTYTDYDDEEDEENEEHQTSPVQVSDKHQTSTRQASPITGTRLPSTDNPLPTTMDEVCATKEPEEKPAERPKSKEDTNQKRFDLFWAAYPKKVGKKDAQRAWKNAKVKTALFEKIMTAIGKARTTEQWTKENGRYIPNPSTWINQGRWDDEIEEVKTNGEHRSFSGPNNTEPNTTKPWREGTAAPGFKQARDPSDTE